VVAALSLLVILKMKETARNPLR